MVSELERLLFNKELDRLSIDFMNCTEAQVCNNIHEDINLLRQALECVSG